MRPTQRTATQKRAILSVDWLEDRRLLSAAPTVPFGVLSLPPAAEHRAAVMPPGVSTTDGGGNGIGHVVREWTHSGIHGQELASSIHELQGNTPGSNPVPGSPGTEPPGQVKHDGLDGATDHGGTDHGGTDHGGTGHGDTDHGGRPVGESGRPVGGAGRSDEPSAVPTQAAGRASNSPTPIATNGLSAVPPSADSGAGGTAATLPASLHAVPIVSTSAEAAIGYPGLSPLSLTSGFGAAVAAWALTAATVNDPSGGGSAAGVAGPTEAVGPDGAFSGFEEESPELPARARDMVFDLSAVLPESGAIEQTFARLADLADRVPGRSWLPWLAAAGMLGLASEMTRRQLRSRGRDETEFDADVPPPGWLPEPAGDPDQE